MGFAGSAGVAISTDGGFLAIKFRSFGVLFGIMAGGSGSAGFYTGTPDNYMGRGWGTTGNIGSFGGNWIHDRDDHVVGFQASVGVGPKFGIGRTTTDTVAVQRYTNIDEFVSSLATGEVASYVAGLTALEGVLGAAIIENAAGGASGRAWDMVSGRRAEKKQHDKNLRDTLGAAQDLKKKLTEKCETENCKTQ